MPTAPPVRKAMRMARCWPGVLRGRRDADVAADREPHAGEADVKEAKRADHEEDRPADA